jgi:hypothetical protein
MIIYFVYIYFVRSYIYSKSRNINMRVTIYIYGEFSILPGVVTLIFKKPHCV